MNIVECLRRGSLFEHFINTCTKQQQLNKMHRITLGKGTSGTFYITRLSVVTSPIRSQHHQQFPFQLGQFFVSWSFHSHLLCQPSFIFHVFYKAGKKKYICSLQGIWCAHEQLRKLSKTYLTNLISIPLSLMLSYSWKANN